MPGPTSQGHVTNDPALLGFAILDALVAMMWLVSAYLDEKPFETESKGYGLFIAMFAFLMMFAAGASFFDSRMTKFAMMAKLPYAALICWWCLYLFLVREKYLNKNWGYGCLIFTCAIDTVVEVGYLFYTLNVNNTAGSHPLSAREQELIRGNQRPPMQQRFTQPPVYGQGPAPQYGSRPSSALGPAPQYGSRPSSGLGPAPQYGSRPMQPMHAPPYGPPPPPYGGPARPHPGATRY